MLTVDKLIGGPKPDAVIDRNIDIKQGLPFIARFQSGRVERRNPHSISTNGPDRGGLHSKIFDKPFSPESIAGTMGAEIKRLEEIALTHPTDQLGVFATDILAKRFYTSVKEMGRDLEEEDTPHAQEDQRLAEALLKSLQTIGREASVNVLANSIDNLPYTSKKGSEPNDFDVNGLAWIENELGDISQTESETSPIKLLAEQYTLLLDKMAQRSPTIEQLLTNVRKQHAVWNQSDDKGYVARR